MDPNAARATLIELANKILAREGQPLEQQDHELLHAETVQLAEAVHDLDEWLRKGGFLPEEWAIKLDVFGETQRGRQQDVDIHVPHRPEDSWGDGITSRIEVVPDPAGKAVDDERPRVDGGVCGHVDLVTERGILTREIVCSLDRGHEGPHA